MNMLRPLVFSGFALAASAFFACDGESSNPGDDDASTSSSASSASGGGASSSQSSTSTGNMGTPGSITLSFQNVFDGAPLVLGTSYTDADGDPFQYSMIRYWVSNVVLSGSTEHTVPDAYYLVEQTSSNTRTDVTIAGIPAGDYDTIAFGLGVDSGHNHSTDVFVGELSTAVDMDWGWNSGFIFVKTEGQYFNEGSQGLSAYSAHIGTDANYRTVTLALPTPVTVDGAVSPVVTVHVEASMLADGFDFNTADSITFGPQGPTLMNIYAGWFSVAAVD